MALTGRDHRGSAFGCRIPTRRCEDRVVERGLEPGANDVARRSGLGLGFGDQDRIPGRARLVDPVAEHRLLDAATAEFWEGRAAAELGEISVDHEPCDPRDRAIDAGAKQANARHRKERGEQADHDRGSGAEGRRGQSSVCLGLAGRAKTRIVAGSG